MNKPMEPVVVVVAVTLVILSFLIGQCTLEMNNEDNIHKEKMEQIHNENNALNNLIPNSK